jgi:hypothetical protein
MAASPDAHALDAGRGQPVQKADSVSAGAAQDRGPAQVDLRDTFFQANQGLGFRGTHHAGPEYGPPS